MNMKKWVILSIVVLFLLFVIANIIFYENIQEGTIELKEGKLVKNKGLTLVPGEKYKYVLRSNGEELFLEFTTAWFYGGCVQIYIFESDSGVCMKSDGTDQSGFNSTLSHPQIIFFKPWMLALEKDWEWKVEYIDKNMNRTIIEYNYRVIGEENIYGRESYIVEITSIDKNITQWIDKDKRILLKEVGPQHEVEITEAPFTLEED